MAKTKKTLDESSLRAMANLATASSDLSKLQENLGWNTEETTAADEQLTPPIDAKAPIPTNTAAPVEAANEAPLTQAPSPPVVEETTIETPVSAPTEVLSKGAKETTPAAGKKIDKYTNAYLQPIKGFERPTKVAYISKRTHSYISFLQRYADLTGSKVSMQEIMENVFRQHFADNKTEIEAMRATLQQKEAELHE